MASILEDIEREARKIAARKMRLVKDREGKRLPDDLWRQCIPEAKEVRLEERVTKLEQRVRDLEARTGLWRHD